MSYILDALRKSERERQAGQVPGLPNLVSDGDKKSAHWLFWLVAVLLLINFGGLTYWLFLRPGQEPQVAAVPASPAMISPAARADQALPASLANAGLVPQGQATAPIAVPSPVSPVPPPTPSIQPAGPVTPVMPAAPLASHAASSVVANAPAPRLPEPMNLPPAVPAPVPVQGQTQPQPQMPAAAMPEPPASVQTPAAMPQPNKAPPVQRAMVEPAPRTAIVPAPSATSRELPYFPPENSLNPRQTPARVSRPQEEDFDEVDAEMEAEGERLADARSYDHPSQQSSVRHGIRSGTPQLRDLPVEFQEKVPPFKITMFAYSKNPAERFVIIDMKKSRVGDRLPGGILLLEIQSENLVLELDGQKFMIPRY